MVEIAEGAGPDKRNYRVSCDLIARQLPAFQPQWDARRGALELIAAYREIGLSKEAFDGPRYKRLAHIQGLLRDGSLAADLRWS